MIHLAYAGKPKLRKRAGLDRHQSARYPESRGGAVCSNPHDRLKSETGPMQTRKRVFFYTLDFFPQRSGAGSPVRAFSNIRAYLDAGYETELVYIQLRQLSYEYDADLAGLRVVTIDAAKDRASHFQHMAYLAGMPYSAAAAYFFRGHAALRRAVQERSDRWPDVIHHFEKLTSAHIATYGKKLNAVWSSHDIPSELLECEIDLDQELEGRKIQAWEARKLAFVRRAERATAERISLLLCISPADLAGVRQRWGLRNAEFLPFP